MEGNISYHKIDAQLRLCGSYECNSYDSSFLMCVYVQICYELNKYNKI